MRMNSAGNVGIGTTSPIDKLHIVGGLTSTSIATPSNTTVGSLQIGYDGTNGIIRTYASSPLITSTYNYQAFETSGNERMRITSAGDICVATSSSSYGSTNRGNITIGGTASSLLAFQTGGTGRAYIYSDGSSLSIANNATGGIYISTAGGGQANLMNNGNLLIGTATDNGERLYVSGSIRATGSITANSDARLKKNIERIENALEKVGQISGYTYNTIYDEDRHAGVIAQEVDKVLPEIVNKGNDGLMGVEYGNISALLIEAIKEQKVLIESLQAKVEALSK